MALLEKAAIEIKALLRCGEPLGDDDLAIIRSTAKEFLSFLAEHDAAQPAQSS